LNGNLFRNIAVGVAVLAALFLLWRASDRKVTIAYPAAKTVVQAPAAANPAPADPAPAVAPASTTPVAPAADKCTQAHDPEQVSLVPGGCLISGDISVGSSQSGPWTFLGAGKDHVGLEVQLSSDTWVRFPYGGSVLPAGTNADTHASDMEATGCTDGCNVVLLKDGSGKVIKTYQKTQ